MVTLLYLKPRNNGAGQLWIATFEIVCQKRTSSLQLFLLAPVRWEATDWPALWSLGSGDQATGEEGLLDSAQSSQIGLQIFSKHPYWEMGFCKGPGERIGMSTIYRQHMGFDTYLVLTLGTW